MPSLPDRRGYRRASRTLGAAGALALTVSLPLLGARPGAAAPVPAQAGGERVVSFVVDATLTQPGSPTDRPVLTVHESIDYDFGGQSRHGIFRFVPVQFRCETVGLSDACPAGFDRVTPMTAVHVSSPSGAPTQVKLTTESGSRVIRIGDPKRTVGGRQRYDITYQVTGVMNPNPDGGSELAWNLTGNGWQVPIDAVDATITVPAVPTAVRCVRGVAGSRLGCEPAGGGTTKVTVHAEQLGVGEGATVYVSLPSGAAVTTPVLDRRWTLDRAFSRTPGSFGAVAATGVVGALLLRLFGRRGRDRRFAGSDVDLAMGRAGQAEIPLGLREKLPQVMEFAPPDKLLPGQVGALVDETVDTRDITATIVDLAIRGHLRITEIAGPAGRDGQPTVADHQLDRTMAPPGGQGLLGFEQLLLDKLFATGSPVLLSALKQKWATSFGAVRSQLYTDLVEHGWYERRPDQQRARATALAVVGLAGSIAVTVALARTTTFGLAGLPLVLAALAGFAVARRAPVRTAAGTAVAARSHGFRRLMETPTQQEMAHFAERHEVFIQYLPFAIAFGCTSQWARTFAGLATAGAAAGFGAGAGAGWYVPIGGSAPSFDAIGARVDAFSQSAAANLTASAPSSSSGGGGGGGFSGGGFGGGGGGSW